MNNYFQGITKKIRKGSFQLIHCNGYSNKVQKEIKSSEKSGNYFSHYSTQTGEKD